MRGKKGAPIDAIVEAITQAVSQTSKSKLAPGMDPLNLFRQKKIRVNTTSGVARDLLQNTLDATGRKLAWQLFCGVEMCFLNIHIVALTSVDPVTGSETYRPVD